MYIRFRTFFYAVRHLDSTASYLPTGLHLSFFRSWPSLFLPSSFSSVFLVLSLPYTGCPRKNVPDFGGMFLMLKYTDITQNTYIQS